MNITLLCETNAQGCKLHVAELPGCYTEAETCKDAMAILPIQVRLYCAWCGLPTNEALWMKIAEDIKTTAPALFTAESAPLSKDAYESLKNVAIRTAEDAYTMKNALEAKADFSVFEKETAAIYAAFGYAPTGKDAVQNRKDFFAFLEKNGKADNGIVVSGNESWTAAKAIRRFVMNDRDMAKSVYAAKKSEVLPDPFFLGDDKLNFNVVTFV